MDLGDRGRELGGGGEPQVSPVLYLAVPATPVWLVVQVIVEPVISVTGFAVQPLVQSRERRGRGTAAAGQVWVGATRSRPAGVRSATDGEADRAVGLVEAGVAAAEVVGAPDPVCPVHGDVLVRRAHCRVGGSQPGERAARQREDADPRHEQSNR